MGKFGFIQQDHDQENMFVIPSSCAGFSNRLPPIGSRVSYDVVVDETTGRPRAENVYPADQWAGGGYDPAQGRPAKAPKGCSKGASVKGSSMALPWSGEAWSGGKGAYGNQHAGPRVPLAPVSVEANFVRGAILTGTMEADLGQFGFIKQDSGEENMFVLPSACEAFGGAFPPQGTRVTYGVVVDQKTGRPRADDVQPSRRTGSMAANSGKYGFIQQDASEEKMFVLPASCPEGRLPATGTRVSYDVVIDQK